MIPSSNSAATTPATVGPGADLADLVDEATQRAELADPDVGAGPVDRWVNRIAETAGIAVLATIVILVFVNASLRYLFGWMLIWGDELVISLMPWLGVIGLFLSIRRRQVIRIDYFVESLKPRTANALRLFASILSASVFGYLAVVSLQYVQLFGADRSIYLDLPAYWFTSSLAVGAAIAGAAYLADAWRELRASRGETGP